MSREKFIKLTVLGSGTCVPREDRGSPGFYLEIGKTKILLDCGPGAVRQLVKAGKDYKDIDLVIINHLHVDHACDLPALFHALNYTPDFDRTKDLFLSGGKGFKQFFDNLIKVFPHIKPRPFSYRIKFLDSKIVTRVSHLQTKLHNVIPAKAASDVAKAGIYINGFRIKCGMTRCETCVVNKFNDFTLETVQGNHDLSSIIIKISAFGKKIVYTGDTSYDKKIGKFSKEADLLITECSYPDQRKVEGHLIPTLVGKIASEAKAKVLLLTHFYPPVDKVKIKPIVKKYFSGKVLIAEDLMTVDV